MGRQNVDWDIAIPEGTLFSYFWVVRYSEIDGRKAKLDIYRKRLGGEGHTKKEWYRRIVGIHEYIPICTIRSIMLYFRLKLRSNTVRRELYSDEEAESLEKAIRAGEV